MTALSDITVEPSSGQFVPRTYLEFFALQLSRHLGNPSDCSKYLSLLEHYPEVVLSSAARRAKGSGAIAVEYLEFERELQHGHFDGRGSLPPVIGIQIDRRCVGYVVISRGVVLEEEKRELSAIAPQALRTTTQFFARASLGWTHSPIALIRDDSDSDTRRHNLASAVRSILRAQALPIWDVNRQELFAAFRSPPAKSLQQVHRIAAALVPELSNGTTRRTVLFDAAILALYVDVSRQLVDLSAPTESRDA